MTRSRAASPIQPEARPCSRVADQDEKQDRLQHADRSRHTGRKGHKYHAQQQHAIDQQPLSARSASSPDPVYRKIARYRPKRTKIGTKISGDGRIDPQLLERRDVPDLEPQREGEPHGEPRGRHVSGHDERLLLRLGKPSRRATRVVSIGLVSMGPTFISSGRLEAA